MVNTVEESSSDIDMDSSPRCIEYPVENNKKTEEAPEIQTVALVPINNEVREPGEIAQYNTSFENLCTQLPTTIKIEELHFDYQQT